jgi:quinol-cytochrome oxidoreductase complex cytochrome b subunit/cytochrome c2
VRVGDWLDERTGYRALVRRTLDEPVHGGARWAYVFGSALAFLLAVQIVTGVTLAMFYSPASREAWGSVQYFTHEVRLGWFVRGIHHWSSSAMLILLAVHIGQVFVFRAYKRPREVTWWSGCLLMLIIVGFSLTGYLLPWDQKGYWAARVATSMLGALPGVGGFLQRVAQGGNDFGNLTLTRFFGIHVFLLPGAVLVLLAIHLVLFRRHGVTPHWGRSEEELSAEREPFWPRQVAFDLAFSALVVGALIGWTILKRGAPLDAPADPSSSYLARPEWYFLWLFQLLKTLPGRWEGVGILGVALFGVAFVALVPVLDRARTSHPRDRFWLFAVVAGVVAGMAALTASAAIEDARDPGVAMQKQAAEREARRAFELARLGIPPGGTADLYLNDPIEHGKRLFILHCAACHKAEGKGGDGAPDLTGFGTTGWVQGLLINPRQPRYFGRTKLSSMEPVDATGAEIDTLAAYVIALGGSGPEDPGGAALFDEKGCSNCHARGKEEPLSGPTLGGYASKPWLRGMLLAPGSAPFYGADNEMPSFGGKLTDTELERLATYLLFEKNRPSPGP